MARRGCLNGAGAPNANMKELKSNIKQNITIRPQTLTASANGVAVDTQGYGGAVVCLDVGAVSGTTPTLDVKIQECETSGGTYTDITGATFTQVTAANAAEKIKVDLKAKKGSRKRYIRAVATITGTTPSFALNCLVLMNKSSRQPV